VASRYLILRIKLRISVWAGLEVIAVATELAAEQPTLIPAPAAAAGHTERQQENACDSVRELPRSS